MLEMKKLRLREYLACSQSCLLNQVPWPQRCSVPRILSLGPTKPKGKEWFSKCSPQKLGWFPSTLSRGPRGQNDYHNNTKTLTSLFHSHSLLSVQCNLQNITTDWAPKQRWRPSYLLLSQTLKWGTSLVAQWLRIRLAMQGTRVRALVREDSTCQAATKPVCHNYWAHMPQLLKPVHLEPVLHNEKPLQWEARAPQRRVAPTHCN